MSSFCRTTDSYLYIYFMNRINVSLLVIAFGLICLGSCKKNENFDVECELRSIETQVVTNARSGHIFRDYSLRFDKDKRVVNWYTEDDSYTYSYSKNEVIIYYNKAKVSKVELRNGRAVKEVGLTSNHEILIEYDTQDRMKKLVLGGGSNTATLYYANGNLDYILEEIKGQRMERKHKYEYSTLPNNVLTSIQSYKAIMIGGYVPQTLLGNWSLNLPSKYIYYEDDVVKYTEDYTYNLSAEGKVIGKETKYTRLLGITSDEDRLGDEYYTKTELSSSCN